MNARGTNGCDPAIRAQAVKAAIRGRVSISEVARCFGVSRRALQQWLRDRGVPPRRVGTPSLTRAQEREVVRLYLVDWSLAEIREATGATPPMVRRIVRAAGHPLRTRATTARLDTAEVVRLAKRFGARGAAEVLGCAPTAVYYHLRKGATSGAP